MKTRITAILAGVATLHLLLISVITVSGGCKSPEALKPRKYAANAKEFLPPQQQPTTAQPETVVTTPEAPVLTDTEVPAETAPEIKTPAETVVTVEEKLLTYKVASGDSLWKVARKFGVSTGELAAQNKLGPKSVLRIGQTLVIPPGGVEGYTPAAVSHSKKGVTKKASVGIAAPSGRSASAAASGNGTKYTVVSGDSLWKIAAKHKVKSSAIAEANNISLSTQLKVGQVLTIPGKKATSVADIVSGTKSEKKPEPVTPVEKDLTAEETKAIETLKSEETKSVDDLLKDIPATDAPKETAPEEKITTTVTEIPSSTGDIVEVTEDITIEDFAKKHKVSVDALKKANPGLPDNGKLSASMIITMP